MICAQEAYLQLGLDLVMLIPARTPPHKAVDDEPGPEHRLELCRCAVRGDDRFAVSEIETVRPGPSYTVDTLQALSSRDPDRDMFLILGGDVAAGLPHWRQPERVLSLATVAVAKRRGTARASVDAALASLPGGERAQFFRMPRIAISSTMIRRRVGHGQPVRYLVPDAVSDYITDNSLYRPQEATA